MIPCRPGTLRDGSAWGALGVMTGTTLIGERQSGCRTPGDEGWWTGTPAWACRLRSMSGTAGVRSDGCHPGLPSAAIQYDAQIGLEMPESAGQTGRLIKSIRAHQHINQGKQIGLGSAARVRGTPWRRAASTTRHTQVNQPTALLLGPLARRGEGDWGGVHAIAARRAWTVVGQARGESARNQGYCHLVVSRQVRTSADLASQPDQPPSKGCTRRLQDWDNVCIKRAETAEVVNA
jgi:hypothetical protein